MSLKTMRTINHYLARKQRGLSGTILNTANGKFGDRDPNTGYYDVSLNNGGTVASNFIGTSNAKGNNKLTQIELNNAEIWSDN